MEPLLGTTGNTIAIVGWICSGGGDAEGVKEARGGADGGGGMQPGLAGPAYGGR